MSPRRKKLAVGCATLVVCGLIAWIASMTVRSRTLNEASKGGARGWRGSVYRSDPELGLAPIPGARADEILQPLSDVPSHIDSRGFRVPVDAADAPTIVRPVFLALGCTRMDRASPPRTRSRFESRGTSVERVSTRVCAAAERRSRSFSRAR